VFLGMTNEMGTKGALILFASGLPVLAVASIWAYFGMYLGRSSLGA
jgi:hypothetical protein